jgi:hypothetical protein
MPRARHQNCMGSTTKKASTRLRWSPRRVGDSVMNSRSAKKETSANSTVATVSPSGPATQNTTAMSQEASACGVLSARLAGGSSRPLGLLAQRQHKRHQS